MKKLQLSQSDRILLGVCGGLGNYFEVDPTWIRLIFAAVFFHRGTGLGIYFILWAIITFSNRK
ncbi:PspC domain-containing protein [Globicatella sulfidifaciens]|uniref:PspC domain-containing protein n=1 Tax=Globicatella sulfidifaciens TaxID=136093 RepID=UPI0028905798|nr:PspC domain-containing protein [Globicatella sulfidifaciens]MDT2768277.1 PspC domain-containing protein [Globicatella sulfidifaciens]